MQFTRYTGDAAGAGRLVFAVFAAFVLVPVAIGLVLRWRDHATRRGASVEPPDKRSPRRFTPEVVCLLVAGNSAALLFAVTGVVAIAVPLAFICFVVAILRGGYRPRL